MFKNNVNLLFFLQQTMNLYPNLELGAIQFGIATREQIIAQSVVLICSTERTGDGSVYDTRMGPLGSEQCKTCLESANVCCGHFGHIELNSPIINPLFVTHLQKATCSFDFKIDSASCEIFCQGKKMLPQELLNFVKTKNDPKLTAMILTALPVLPHMNRSSVNQGDQQSDDELTTQYLEIIKSNRRVDSKLPREQLFKAIERLSFAVATLINNSKGKAKHPSSCRKIKSLTERLSGKAGLMRSGIQGKRCDKSARMVCAPGPELQHGEIGVPEHCAKILSRVVVATLFNLITLQQHCDNGRVNLVERLVQGEPCKFSPPRFCVQKQTKLEPRDAIIRAKGLSELVETGREILCQGDTILRNGVVIETRCKSWRNFVLMIGDAVHVQLQNGDVIISNRQPTLHSGSIQSSIVKIILDYCGRIPSSSTVPYNMDFDGDEMNLHLPQTQVGEDDLKICSAREQIINPSTGNPMVMLVQDSVVGLDLMSKNVQQVDLDLIDNVAASRIQEINRVRLNCGIEVPSYPTTYCLISVCLDPLLLIDNDDLQIICGVFVHGQLTKNCLTQLTKICSAVLGNEKCSDMISKLQNISVRWLTRQLPTISGQDILPIPYHQVREDAAIRAEQGDDARCIRDAQHKHVADLNLGQGFRVCIDSGAKGSLINLGQMLCSLGQQTSDMNKLEPMMSGGRLFCSDPIDRLHYTALEKLEHAGYVSAGYAHGLSPREFFLSSICGRSHVVQTSTGTATSGYLQHKIIKLTEDVFVEHGMMILRGGPEQSRTLSKVYNFGRDPRKAYSDKIHNLKNVDICDWSNELRQNTRAG